MCIVHRASTITMHMSILNFSILFGQHLLLTRWQYKISMHDCIAKFERCDRNGPYYTLCSIYHSCCVHFVTVQKTKNRKEQHKNDTNSILWFGKLTVSLPRCNQRGSISFYYSCQYCYYYYYYITILFIYIQLYIEHISLLYKSLYILRTLLFCPFLLLLSDSFILSIIIIIFSFARFVAFHHFRKRRKKVVRDSPLLDVFYYHYYILSIFLYGLLGFSILSDFEVHAAAMHGFFLSSLYLDLLY